MPSVLVLGGTGFVGAPTIRALADAHPDWPITAASRPGGGSALIKSQLEKVASFAEVGDWTDFETIKRLSSEHDIVINAGNSFTADPVTAIVAGLQERRSKDPEAMATLLHISGGGNFIDFGTSGQFNEKSKVWDDSKVDDIKQIHKDMFNGQSDTVVLEAGSTSNIDTYIVCPSIVYGGAAVQASTGGVGYSLVTGNARGLGYVPYVGDGSAVVSTTHIVDLVRFLVTVTEHAAKAAPLPLEDRKTAAYERYYMLETQRLPWKAVATELAAVLHREDPALFPSAEPRQIAEFGDAAGVGEVKHLVAANMLLRGPRAKAMGFQALGRSILEQMSDDLQGWGKKNSTS